MFELKGITAGYDSVNVLRDVSLTVPESSVVALLGPNGAGKTTLLRVASGLLKPYAGTIHVDDRDVTSASSHKLARMGICHVPEGRGIFRALTVAENLRLQAPSGKVKDAIELAAEAFPRLGERLNQKAGTLSGGEQQMLALAHAYLANPSVVLLDEVSMGLAPKIVDQIFEYLRGLVDRGTSLLLVEQYIPRALALADYVYILNRGRVQFVGEPCELDEQAMHDAYLGGLGVAV
jgi:branched-chain amino acid transport system ATP-binding protein